MLPYPLHSGGQVRMYNLFKRLSKTHDIHLFSFIRLEKERQYLSQLSFCKSVTACYRGRGWRPKYIFESLTTPYPLLWASYHNRQMLSLLSDELVKGKYDLIHLEPGYVWPSLPETRTPVVVAEHNIEHKVYEAYVGQFPVGILKPFLMRDVMKMNSWQHHIWKLAAGIITVSKSDQSFINQANVSVVPNGVDVREFVFHPKETMPRNPTFLYVGNFRWMENKDAAEYLIHDWWPVIRAKYPGSRLRIVGDHAPKGQYYIGTVDRIQDELNNADMMLAPIRIGGGTKYKILEAMASGLPVITTKRGIEGMNVTNTRQVLTAQSADEALACVKMIFDSTVRTGLVSRARKLVEKEYSWDTIARALDEAWKGAYERKR